MSELPNLSVGMNDDLVKENVNGTESSTADVMQSLQSHLLSWREPNADLRTEEEEISSVEDDDESTVVQEGEANAGQDDDDDETNINWKEDESELEDSFKSCRDFDNSGISALDGIVSSEGNSDIARIPYSPGKVRKLKLDEGEGVMLRAARRNSRKVNKPGGASRPPVKQQPKRKPRKMPKRKKNSGGWATVANKLTKQVEWLTEQVMQLKGQLTQTITPVAGSDATVAKRKRGRPSSEGKKDTPEIVSNVEVQTTSRQPAKSPPNGVEGSLPEDGQEERDVNNEVNINLNENSKSAPVVEPTSVITLCTETLAADTGPFPVSEETTLIVTSGKGRGRPRKSELSKKKKRTGTSKKKTKMYGKDSSGRQRKERELSPAIVIFRDGEYERNMAGAVQEAITSVIETVTNASKIPLPIALPKAAMSEGPRRKTSAKHFMADQEAENRPHPCDICSKRFTTLQSKCVHKSSVHDGKRWACRYCGKSYKYPGGCRNHVMTVHCTPPGTITDSSSQDEPIVNKKSRQNSTLNIATYKGHNRPQEVFTLDQCNPTTPKIKNRKIRSAEIARTSLFRNTMFISGTTVTSASTQPSCTAVIVAQPSLNCSVCGIKVDTKSGLLRHVKGSHPDYHAGVQYKQESQSQTTSTSTSNNFQDSCSLPLMENKKQELSEGEESLLPD